MVSAADTGISAVTQQPEDTAWVPHAHVTLWAGVAGHRPHSVFTAP